MIGRILWQRTGGYYLFWTGFVYFFAGMIDVFVYKFDTVGALQILWIAALVFPFTYPPFGRWLNMDITWSKNMFNWFGKGKDAYSDEAKNNVYNLPLPKLVTPVPEVAPPKEEPAKIFYRIGATDQNRVAFSMGMMEITMNREGVDNMIKQLEVFRDQLQDEE